MATQYLHRGCTARATTISLLNYAPLPGLRRQRFATSSILKHPATVQRPNVRTDIPGPVAKSYVDELDAVFDVRSLNMVVDYEKSSGN